MNRRSKIRKIITFNGKTITVYTKNGGWPTSVKPPTNNFMGNNQNMNIPITAPLITVKSLQEYMPWVLEALGASSQDELIAINIDKVGAGAVRAKYLDIACDDSAIPVEKLTSVVMHPGIENRLFDMEHKPVCKSLIGKYKDNYKTSSTSMLCKIGLEGCDFPIVMYLLYTVDCSNGYDQETIEFIVVKTKDCGKFLDVFHKMWVDYKRSKLTIYDVSTGDNSDIEFLSWDQLILEDSIKKLVRHDFERFLSRRDWYTQKKLSYRRGYLFHGDPGNGKTSTIRAMISEAKLPTYTVRDFGKNKAEEHVIELFEKASTCKDGCIILLEDIDRHFGLVNDKEKNNERTNVSLSTLLNCLDGVTNSNGLITIATANSPKLLANAIKKRPGRFDRIVEFPNPKPEYRRQYIELLSPELAKADLSAFERTTEGLSFAQLKEVYILANQIADDNNVAIGPNELVEAASVLIDSMDMVSEAKTRGFLSTVGK